MKKRQRRVAAAVITCLASLAVAGSLLRRSEPAQVPLTQVTSFDGYTTDPSVSADGKWQAFASDLSGRGDSDIYVQVVGGGHLWRVTDNPAYELQPTLSPNGREVAYRSERELGGIFVRSIDGGPERLLARFGDNTRFSPDGRLMAYEQTNEGNLGRPSGKIFVVSVAGGTPRQLFPDLPDGRYPAWMDRRQLLFQACSPGSINPRMESDWWKGSIWRSWMAPTTSGPCHPVVAKSHNVKIRAAARTFTPTRAPSQRTGRSWKWPTLYDQTASSLATSNSR